MANLSDFTVSAPDWRAQLRRNQARTRWVIALFFLFYLAVGLLIDTYLYSNTYYNVPIETIVRALLTFQLTPIATLITGAIALISLWATYSFHDKIMLLGTTYREITPQTAKALTEKQLYNVVEELKIAAGLNYLPKVFIIEADYMNAFASGYSEKSAMVAITSGLLAKLERSEVQAVMAHEMSHIRHGDIKLTLMASVLSNILLIAVDLLFYNIVFSRDRRRDGGGGLAMAIIVLRYLLPVMTLLLTLYLSRTREYMADAGCVELMRDNVPLAHALLKIQQDHQANADTYRQEYSQTAHEDVRRAAYLYDPVQSGIEPIQSLANLFSTHPDIKERLAALGIKTSIDR
jgi:heat shock protein HtpX